MRRLEPHSSRRPPRGGDTGGPHAGTASCHPDQRVSPCIFPQPAREILGNPSLALQPPYICGDTLHIIACHTGHRVHLAEPPVVRSHSKFHCTLKRDVGMMARLVRAMDQWRPLLCSPRRFAVTLKAVLGEQAIAGSVLSGCRRRRR